MVENGLEQVLRMVQGRLRGAASKADEANDTPTDDTSNTNDGEKPEAKQDAKDNVLDVAGANEELAVPVFMDIANVKNAPNSAFLAKSNDAGIPNLIYPLNVHHREGVGRMVEEWELAANKQTKRIMMRDATKAIASKIVESTNCCDSAVGDNKKGAARVLVTGKRGVGKVSVCLVLSHELVLLCSNSPLLMFFQFSYPSDSCTCWYSCVCPSQWSCCSLPPGWRSATQAWILRRTMQPTQGFVQFTFDCAGIL